MMWKLMIWALVVMIANAAGKPAFPSLPDRYSVKHTMTMLLPGKSVTVKVQQWVDLRMNRIKVAGTSDAETATTTKINTPFWLATIVQDRGKKTTCENITTPTMDFPTHIWPNTGEYKGSAFIDGQKVNQWDVEMGESMTIVTLSISVATDLPLRVTGPGPIPGTETQADFFAWVVGPPPAAAFKPPADAKCSDAQRRQPFSKRADESELSASFHAFPFFEAAINAQNKAGCNRLKCAGKIITCAAVCIGSLGSACLSCLGGASGCISCF